MDELLSVAKELLEDFDLYGTPVRLDVIAKLRRAVEAAQQSVQSDAASCAHDFRPVKNNSEVCVKCRQIQPRR